MPGTSVTLCGIVRNEGPYLLEWIAWYKLLGIHRIVIYDNDSRDASVGILKDLHQAGEILLYPWPDRPGEPPQIPAYRDAVARCSTEWVAFLDIDEFLVVHGHRHLTALLEAMPEECSAVAFNQRFFGSSGQLLQDDRLVIERFIRAPPPHHPMNAWVKTVARTRRIKEIVGPHACKLSSGYYAEPSGSPCIIEEYSRSRKISLGAGQYNHYILKSQAEYLQKRVRGRATVTAGDPSKHAKYSDQFFALHDQNQVIDDSAARKAELVHGECDRLRALCSD
jgi:hypothetical protein